MTREEEAIKTMQEMLKDCHRKSDALSVAITALRDSRPDPDTGCPECGRKMRIDIPPGNDSVRASTGFQRDGGDKTERRCMANQCVICGAEMPEGDQVCGYCRRQHGY